MKTCPTCQTELADNARTCPKCGQVMPTGGSIGVAIVIGVIIGGLLLWFLTRNL